MSEPYSWRQIVIRAMAVVGLLIVIAVILGLVIRSKYTDRIDDAVDAANTAEAAAESANERVTHLERKILEAAGSIECPNQATVITGDHPEGLAVCIP